MHTGLTFPESKGKGANAIEKRVEQVDVDHVSDSKEKRSFTTHMS